MNVVLTTTRGGKCCCGSTKVVVEDNEPDFRFYKAPYHNIRYRARCTKCNVKTKFYPDSDQAVHAIESKGWVNRRVAA
jgi:hypothetical protein